MAKKPLSLEEKKLDVDLWIIALITLGVFLCYKATGDQLMDFVTNQSVWVVPRLLVNGAVQYGIAGLGISIVCVLRKESFTSFGLRRQRALSSILGATACFIPYLSYIAGSGQYQGYRPLSILLTKDVLDSNFPIQILGILWIGTVWGFFEGFNFVVISDKLNARYPSKNQWLDVGAIVCAVVCLLFHPLSPSFWGMIEMIVTFLAIYGMLIVRKKTQNSWGCVFVFCLIWNAF